VRQPVVARVAGPPADDLDDDGEDRNAQDEGREVQVELGDRPHGQPRAEGRERPVRRFLGGLLGLHRQHGDEQRGGRE
jgi:hypothetical protein